MRIKQATEIQKIACQHRRRVLFVGKPGVGKTEAKMEAMRQIGWDYLAVCAPIEDPSTIRGYPAKGADGRATHMLFDTIAKAFDATKPTLLDFDEIGGASESTCKSVLRLFQFGEINNRKLPEHVVLGASTNDVGHGAGVQGMIEPLKSRFHTIINVETNLDDVVGYGLSRGWHPGVLAYLRNDPEALNDWKPLKSMHIGGACPRGWEYASQWINLGVTDPEVIAGCVGKGHATQCLAFIEMMNELPDVDQIPLNPDTAPVPENPSAKWLISMALASRMSANNFGSILTYLQRLPQNFRAIGIRDAFRCEDEKREGNRLPDGYRKISSSRDYAAWVLSAEGRKIMGIS